jgi:hypothetical protein
MCSELPAWHPCLEDQIPDAVTEAVGLGWSHQQHQAHW